MIKISQKCIPIPYSGLRYSSIISDNGLVPIRWQVIIWTNDGYITDAYMLHSVSGAKGVFFQASQAMNDLV